MEKRYLNEGRLNPQILFIDPKSGKLKYDINQVPLVIGYMCKCFDSKGNLLNPSFGKRKTLFVYKEDAINQAKIAYGNNERAAYIRVYKCLGYEPKIRKTTREQRITSSVGTSNESNLKDCYEVIIDYTDQTDIAYIEFGRIRELREKKSSLVETIVIEQIPKIICIDPKSGTLKYDINQVPLVMGFMCECFDSKGNLLNPSFGKRKVLFIDKEDAINQAKIAYGNNDLAYIRVYKCVGYEPKTKKTTSEQRITSSVGTSNESNLKDCYEVIIDYTDQTDIAYIEFGEVRKLRGFAETIPVKKNKPKVKCKKI